MTWDEWFSLIRGMTLFIACFIVFCIFHWLTKHEDPDL